MKFLSYAQVISQVLIQTSAMLENQGDMIGRLRSGEPLSDNEIEQIIQLLQSSIRQDVSQSGEVNLAVGDGRDIQVGDRYSGATTEQIHAIVAELLQALGTRQPEQTESSPDSSENAEDTDDEPNFRRLILDPSTLEAVNTRLEIIMTIASAGYLSPDQKREFQQILKHLQSYNDLNDVLEGIVDQGDRLIERAIAAMRLQLDALALSGRQLTNDHQAQLSTQDLDCQQQETQIFQKFVHQLEDSRDGADWIDRNTETLARYGTRAVRKQFSALECSQKTFDDFQFSLKQFLEQVSFSLHWGNYDILDSPEIPLILNMEYYEAAFQAIKKGISKQLRSEVIHEIENCLDYLIERLSFY